MASSTVIVAAPLASTALTKPGEDSPWRPSWNWRARRSRR
jgi:hypothetical protein